LKYCLSMKCSFCTGQCNQSINQYISIHKCHGLLHKVADTVVVGRFCCLS
jgi:hypothetical protein